jgi:lipid II:glycine glycyltransferase (peptidoglycan interpeptide bridge formation enzyme)
MSISLSPCALSSCDSAASFLQSAFWGEFKSRFGWRAYGFKNAAAEEENTLLVLHRSLVPGISMAYVPWGPEIEDISLLTTHYSLFAVNLAESLKAYLPRSTAFLRLDPPWYSEGAGIEAPILEAPFRKAANVQAPDTVLVDLRPDEGAVLKAMKPKCRYNIGLSGKRGVKVTRPDADGIGDFYRLFQETAARDHIAIHSIGYYEALFEAAAAHEGLEAHLYLAEHEGDKLAAIITLFRPPVGTYLYGASSNIKRNLMAPYALQWAAMRDAKALGCTSYDLFGIPPDANPAHPMHGLYQFKTGFNGRIIHRPGSWDYVYRPLAAKLFETAEGMRKRMMNRKKNPARSSPSAQR